MGAESSSYSIIKHRKGARSASYSKIRSGMASESASYRKMYRNARKINENEGKRRFGKGVEKGGKGVEKGGKGVEKGGKGEARRNARWPHTSLRGSRIGFRSLEFRLCAFNTALARKGLAVFNRSAHSAGPGRGQ